MSDSTRGAPLESDLGRETAAGRATAAEREQAQMRSLDPAFLRCEHVGTWIVAAILAAGGTTAVLTLPAFDTVSWRMALVWTALIPLVDALLLVLGRRYDERAFERTRYRLDAVGLVIHRGVLWRRQVTVPRSRVQHTDVSQGPLQRRYGLATLTVHTAGSEDASVELSGLAHAEALRLRDDLIASAAARPVVRSVN
jgi:membrane protein YdbS with pleckstrin-like domain